MMNMIQISTNFGGPTHVWSVRAYGYTQWRRIQRIVGRRSSPSANRIM